ncbi:MAG: hypothetical protein FJ095_13200 [Deltaproteobacteria bacterium]|nr:hypothetical protein [Deltaproteobacteria bacterium]
MSERKLRFSRLRAWVALAIVASPSLARAEGSPPARVMREPGEVVDVIDAFDDDDPFDFAVSVGYQFASKSARILRESPVFEPGLTTGGFTARTMKVGQFIGIASVLTPRIDVGLYKDLALYATLPITLSDERRIDDLDGSAAKAAVVAAGAPGEQLFSIPFRSPNRSGIQYVGLGIDYSLLNQARDVTKPTWVFGLETRIAAGTPMHACDAAQAVQCTHPGDINRNGQFDTSGPNLTTPGGAALEAQGLTTRTPGVTRGTIGLEFHSAISKRVKYIEPYGAFSALFEFQQGGESDFGQTDLQGALVNHPPIVGTVSLGLMIHPWENRESFSRLTFDFRFDGTYRSEGRDYSELFDALGSSAALSLRRPRWSRYRGCTQAEIDAKTCSGETISVVDESSQKTYFSGLTVVEPYGSYRASSSVTWRIAEFVKLNLGMAMRFDQAHGITHDQPCNPNFKDNPYESGPCHFTAGSSQAPEIGATGIPNPAYRPTINGVGRRFYVDESVTYEIFARGVVLF